MTEVCEILKLKKKNVFPPPLSFPSELIRKSLGGAKQYPLWYSVGGPLVVRAVARTQISCRGHPHMYPDLGFQISFSI